MRCFRGFALVLSSLGGLHLFFARVAGGNASTYNIRTNISAEDNAITLCLLLMVRDEEQNLRLNLPLWRDIIDCYVIGIDMRTKDGTAEAIHSSLPEDRPRHVFFLGFQDFSQARNLVLEAAWQRFPAASHVLIGDADWRPDPATVSLPQLDNEHAAFEFLIHDRSHQTTRTCTWLVPHRAGIRFKYRIHEVLEPPGGLRPAKWLPWEVAEVETNSSWHTPLHAHSRSADRYAFDLSLLRLDVRDMPDDLHSLYYLGITLFAYMETKLGNGRHQITPEMTAMISEGVASLIHAWDLYKDLGPQRDERVSGSIKWAAYAHQFFLGDQPAAQRMYRQCVGYDPRRPDCRAFLSRSLLESQDVLGAWDEARLALATLYPDRLALSFFYLYECFLPVQALRALHALLQPAAPALPSHETRDSLVLLGQSLLRHQRLECTGGPLVDSKEDVASLQVFFDAAAAAAVTAGRRPLDLDAARAAALAAADPPPSTVLARKWGSGAHARDFSEALPSALAAGSASGTNDSTGGGGGGTAAIVDVIEGASGEASVAASSGAAPVGASDACVRLTRPWETGAILRDAAAGGGAGDDGGAQRRVLWPVDLVGFEQVSGDAAGRAASGSYRTLIVGTPDLLGPGREAYEVGQLVELHRTLAGRKRPFDVTYLHPEVVALEAAHAALRACGGRFKDVQLAHGTIEQLLEADILHRFDYVDFGGFLSGAFPAAATDRDHDARAVAALKGLAARMSDGGMLRLWVVAATPETASLTALRESAASLGAAAIEGAVRRFAATSMGVGDTAAVATAPAAAVRAGVTVAVTTATVEDWGPALLRYVRTYTLPQVGAVLAAAGFLVVAVLADGCKASDAGRAPPASLAALEAAWEGLSFLERCEMLAEMRQPRPLVHQVLAVRTGSESGSGGVGGAGGARRDEL